ncbi:MAG: zinc transporter ZntB [Maricaulaceae bacterium]|nr:zinc transporter ZntB [Maricaulaceae bacterium]
MPLDAAAQSRSPGDNSFSFVWIHLDRGEPASLKWLEQASGLDGFVQEALTAADTRPRCTVHGEGAVLILRGVNLNPGAKPEDMISLRLWVEAGRVIGVYRRPLMAVGDLLQAMDRGAAPVSPGDLAAKLALRLADRMEPTVTVLGERIDSLEERVDAVEGGPFRAELAAARRLAIMLRRFIAPQRDALSTLAIEDLPWLSERDRSRLREATDRTTRVAEELDSLRERASIVHEQLVDKRAEDMNRRILLLSVVAAIFLPLGLFASMLGMNVEGIPFADRWWAFAAVSALLTVIGFAQYALFRWLKLT